MNPNQLDVSPARKRNWGWIVLLIALAALLIDVGLGLVFKAQLSQREQAKSRQWTTYSYPTPILPNQSYLRVFLVDALGRVWISTPSGAGLSMLNPDGAWTTYTTSNSALPPRNILALASDKTGRLAIMTSEGVSILSPDGNWTSLIRDNLPALFTAAHIEPYHMAFGAQGEIWITAGKFNELDMITRDGSWVSYYKYLPGWPLEVDNQGNVWIGGCFTHLRKLDSNGNWILLAMPGKTDEFGCYYSDSTDAAIDKQGRLWITADWDGLFMVDPGGKWTSYTDLLSTPFVYPYFLRYTFGSPNDEILRANKVAVDSRGNVWFTSIGPQPSANKDTIIAMNSLSKLSQSGRLISYLPIPSCFPPGVPDVNDPIIGLGIDTQDRVWIGRYSGIAVFDETSPFLPHTDLYTELVNFSAKVFWAQITGMGLILVSVFSFLSARALIDRASIVSFIAGLLGWFVFNSINKYFFDIVYFINAHFCPIYESDDPDCEFLISPGFMLFMVLLNVGISVFLFKTKRLWGMSGFLVAFIINTIFQAVLGQSGLTTKFFNVLLPFFL